MLAGQTCPVFIAVDATSVYWTSCGNGFSTGPGTVMKAPIGGGTLTTLASAQSFPQGIALDPTSVYWVNSASDPNTGTVMKMPIGGGTLTTLASGQNNPVDVAVDATSVYWAVDDYGGAVMKAAK